MVIFVALVLASALGGCLSADEEAGDLETGGDGQGAQGNGQGGGGGGDGGGSGSTGTIRGEVVDVGFDPVAGASVELLQGDELLHDSLTLDNGSYEFTDLEPGEYRLKFSASCCKQLVRGAVVKPGEVTTVTAQLEEHKPVEGYVVRDEWNGFIGCSAVLPVTGVLFNPQGACAETDPNNDPVHDFELEPGLQTVVVGMVWDEEITNPMGDLRIMMSKDSAFLAESSRFFTLEGASPLEIVLGPEDAQAGEPYYFANIEETWPARFTVTGSWEGSVVYQQPFTVYYDLYYNEPAPEGASALPE